MCEDIPLRITEDAAKQALGNLKISLSIIVINIFLSDIQAA